MINRNELKLLLAEKLEAMKARNPALSIRAYARRLGLSSAALSEILRGKRPISDKLASKLVQLIDLTDAEKSRIFVEQAASAGILPFQPKPTFTVLPQDRYEAVAAWYHFAILSLAETSDFQSDPFWIAQRLNISPDTALSAIKRLSDLRMLKRDNTGAFRVSGESFCTSDGIAQQAIREAHKQNLKLAEASLDRDAISEREFRSITVAINPKNIPAAKKLIGEFRDRLTTFLEAGEKTEVYNFCMQLFPVSFRDIAKSGENIALLALFVLAFVTASAPARAGGHGVNNGGGAMICPSATHATQEQVEMLDLWEARVTNQLSVEYSTKPVTSENLREEVLGIIERSSVDPLLKKALLKWSIYVLSQINGPSHMLPTGIGIAAPLDGGNGFIGRGCRLAGLALFDNLSNRVYVDDELFDRMSLTDRVALVLHEASYKVFRDWFNVEESLGTRRFVGCLMAGSSCKDLNLSDGIVADQYGQYPWLCQSTKLDINSKAPAFSAFVTGGSDGLLRWQFLSFNGHPLPTKTVLTVPFAGVSVDTRDPFQIGDTTHYYLKSYMAFSTGTRLLAAPHGQTLPVRYGTATNEPFTKFTIDDEPVVCRFIRTLP